MITRITLAALSVSCFWSASFADVTYDEISVEHRSGAYEKGEWSLLSFKLTGVSVNGEEYDLPSGVGFEFATNVASPRWYELKLINGTERGATVRASFPDWRPNERGMQASINSSGYSPGLAKAMGSWSQSDRDFVAWLIVNAEEFAAHASQTARFTDQRHWQIWRSQTGSNLEATLRKNAGILQSPIAQIDEEASARLALTKFHLRDVQRFLKSKKVYQGDIDGSYGPQTAEAIKWFQREQGRLPTGIPTVEQLLHLKALSLPKTSGLPVRTPLVPLALTSASDGDQLLKARRQIVQLKKDLANAEASESSSNEADLSQSALNQELVDAKAQMAKLEKDLANALASQSDVEGAVTSESAVNRALARALEDYQEVLGPHDTPEDIQKLVEQAKAAKEQADQKAVSLGATIARLNDDLTRFEAELAAVETIKAEHAELLAEKDAGLVPVADLVAAQEQIDALASTLAELRNTTVPVTEYREAEKRLDAATASLADLRASTVSNKTYAQALAELDAVTATVAELRDRIDQEYVPATMFKDRETELSSQVAALNASLVEARDSVDTYRRRLLDVQTLYSNFIDECKADSVCGTSMGLVD